ncbi:hypothetical protein TNCV_5088331 [Trichonephila clavipes]|nr:hypothetical protein TNCV_5088331 [Trichonephila clavipes]
MVMITNSLSAYHEFVWSSKKNQMFVPKMNKSGRTMPLSFPYGGYSRTRRVHRWWIMEISGNKLWLQTVKTKKRKGVRELRENLSSSKTGNVRAEGGRCSGNSGEGITI